MLASESFFFFAEEAPETDWLAAVGGRLGRGLDSFVEINVRDRLARSLARPRNGAGRQSLLFLLWSVSHSPGLQGPLSEGGDHRELHLLLRSAFLTRGENDVLEKGFIIG